VHDLNLVEMVVTDCKEKENLLNTVFAVFLTEEQLFMVFKAFDFCYKTLWLYYCCKVVWLQCVK
jgi:hypothetical protein